ncbi:MAG: ATP-binding protein [Candidatus Zixiibacteriota bacterium]|jgi:serine/threonine-protein kinase RsbW
MAEREYQFRIRSQVSQLEKVRKWAAYIARALGFAERAVFEIELSIYEACANVIEHAYSNDPGNYIDVKIAVELDRLIVTIRDEGGAFQTSELKEKDIARIIETEQDGGLGMHIIEACMDEILYRRQGRTNILELVKYLPRVAHAP